MSLIPLPRMVSRHDIDCPGDIISYNCSIQSNSETLHLIWRVTLPGHSVPIDRVYNESSALNMNVTSHINTYLSRYVRDEYIESTLAITVWNNASNDRLTVQCLIEKLGNDSVAVLIQSSSKHLF